MVRSITACLEELQEILFSIDSKTHCLYAVPTSISFCYKGRVSQTSQVGAFDFMVRMWLGDRAAWLLTSLIVSTTNGLELTIPSTSTNKVLSDSSSKLAPCLFMRSDSMFLADRISLYHTQPILLANGGFFFH